MIDYSRDRSHFRVEPVEIAAPASVDECRALVARARESGLGVTARGGGTGLAGQALGDGLIVDLSRHFTGISAYDAETGLIRAESGVTPAALARALEPCARAFAPYPSTGAVCTLGGMFANNAWGVNAPCFGATVDHVESVEVVLADGTAREFGPVDPCSAKASSLERTVFERIDAQRALILAAYPPPAIPNNAGYALDRIARGRPWVADAAPFNLARLLAGSEGTLALVTALTLRTVPAAKQRFARVLRFDSASDAVAAVPGLLTAATIALEMLDASVLAAWAQTNAGTTPPWAEHAGGALLIQELDPDATESLPPPVRESITLRDAEVEAAWTLRRTALESVSAIARSDGRKPVSGFEDTAVPIARLPEYTRAFLDLLAAEGLDCVVYGSAGMGVLYFRPFLNLDDRSDRQRFDRLQRAQAELVWSFGGTVTAKHGDGRLRSHLLRDQYPADVISIWRDIKRLFDPHGVFTAGFLAGCDPENH
ncbi:MAG: FAD-binding oxidoreductase [Chromatiales bacterium]|nr:FAD-binding oxidoreductase [Chromatiales bacterium]